MPLWFNKKLDFTVEEMRIVMAMSNTGDEMAKLLGCTSATLYKYIKEFNIGTEVRTTLKSNNKKNKKIRKMKKTENFKKISLSAILSGKHPTYNRNNLKTRLIAEGIFEERCNTCGFEERRLLDYQVPLVLLFKDGNKQNHQKENMEFCCYNCFFLNYNDFKIKTDNFTLNKLYKINN